MEKRTKAKRKNLQQLRLRRSFNPRQLDWLMESTSLTERMSQESKKDFSVKRLPTYPAHSLPKVLRRQVILCYKGRPWVYAESTLRRAELGWRQHYLNLLGNRSIGTLVIQKYRLKKTLFRVEPVVSGSALMRRLQLATGASEPQLWSRYAEYQWGRHVLEVKEVFLPASKMLG